MKVTTDGCLFGAWVTNELSKDAYGRALDIGAGTGLLSLMIAQKNKLLIDAVEIDAPAAKQAVENVKASPFRTITVIEEDILKLPTDTYDVIVSNPPFYENELTSGKLQKDTAHHSRDLKWSDLFKVIHQRLRSEGKFFLLLPFKRKKEAEDLMAANGLFVQKIVQVKPSVAQAPFRLMMAGSKQQTDIIESKIIIKDADQNYTGEFSALLKDYYLYL